MKRLLTIVALILTVAPAAFSLPSIQLAIDGAEWDAATETWITSASTFDLYVIGKAGLNDVHVSMALGDFAPGDDPNTAGVSIGGVGTVDPFVYGYAPASYFPSSWNGGNNDLPKHDIFPAWYTEFNAGDFGAVGGLGNVNPDSAAAAGESLWLPTDGYIAGGNHIGEFRKFTISVSGSAAVHFDAYTLNDDGTIDKFAPFSHDAGTTSVPEPATMLLVGLGLAGAGVYRKFRR